MMMSKLIDNYMRKMKIVVVLYVDRCRRTVFTTGDEVSQTGKNIETVSGEL